MKSIEVINAATAIAIVRSVIVDVFIFKKYVFNIIIYNNIKKSNTNKKPSFGLVYFKSISSKATLILML